MQMTNKYRRMNFKIYGETYGLTPSNPYLGKSHNVSPTCFRGIKREQRKMDFAFAGINSEIELQEG